MDGQRAILSEYPKKKVRKKMLSRVLNLLLHNRIFVQVVSFSIADHISQNNIPANNYHPKVTCLLHQLVQVILVHFGPCLHDYTCKKLKIFICRPNSSYFELVMVTLTLIMTIFSILSCHGHVPLVHQFDRSFRMLEVQQKYLHFIIYFDFATLHMYNNCLLCIHCLCRF